MVTGLDVLDFFADINLILKLFVLLMIIGFVQNHLGKGPMAVALMAFISFFVLFDAWKIFGGIYMLYAIITLGFSGILIDFFFVTPPLANQREQEGAGSQEGVNSRDVDERLHRIQHAQRGHNRPPGPPPMMG